jgi:hypothetical protein
MCHQDTEPALVALSAFRVGVRHRPISVASFRHHMNDTLLPDRLKQVTKASLTLEDKLLAGQVPNAFVPRLHCAHASSPLPASGKNAAILMSLPPSPPGIDSGSREKDK